MMIVTYFRKACCLCKLVYNLKTKTVAIDWLWHKIKVMWHEMQFCTTEYTEEPKFDEHKIDTFTC